MKKIIILIVFCVVQNSYSMDNEDYQELETFLEQGPLALLHNNNDSQDNIHELSDVPFDFEQFFNESNGDLSIENPTKKQKVELVCYNCSAFCNSQSKLIAHFKKYHPGQKPFKCPYECNKAFGLNCHLKRHIKTHTDERPYVCKYEGCGQAFANRSDLIEHASTHIKEKSYIWHIQKGSFV